MTTFFTLEVKETFPTKHAQKGSSGVKKGRGLQPIICPANLPETFMLESILAKRCIGEVCESDQIWACSKMKQDDWAEGTQKIVPI